MNDDLMASWPEQPLAVVISAGGMGMAVARRLGERYRLLLADVNAERLESRVSALREEGLRVDHAVCDVTSRSSVAGLAARVREIGSFRVLAHVAGVSPSMADWRTIMSVNLVGPTLMADALLPLAGPGTAAVFVSSVSAHLFNPDTEVVTLLRNPLAPDFLDKLAATLGAKMTPDLSYPLSKYALNQMCERQALAWGQRRARIMSISPGLISTPQGMLEFKHKPSKVVLLKKTPLQRQGNMLEIADAIEFLTSDRASFITGINLLVDGGLSAAVHYSNEAQDRGR